jgi:hypothetical protein
MFIPEMGFLFSCIANCALLEELEIMNEDDVILDWISLEDISFLSPLVATLSCLKLGSSSLTVHMDVFQQLQEMFPQLRKIHIFIPQGRLFSSVIAVLLQLHSSIEECELHAPHIKQNMVNFQSILNDLIKYLQSKKYTLVIQHEESGLIGWKLNTITNDSISSFTQHIQYLHAIEQWCQSGINLNPTYNHNYGMLYPEDDLLDDIKSQDEEDYESDEIISDEDENL